jgi:hypothetical protein
MINIPMQDFSKLFNIECLSIKGKHMAASQYENIANVDTSVSEIGGSGRQ